MPSARTFPAVALLGLLVAPVLARAGDLYSFVDADGVVHFTNAPSDRRFRRVTRTSDVAGVYRTSPRPSTAAGTASVAGGASGAANRALERYLAHVRSAADKYKLPPALLLAVMAVESNFDARAVSEKGAMGLMQLMPGTAREMYVSDVYDPGQNIDGGARYLRILANQYSGDMVRTLAAYNAGPDAVRRAGDGVPDIPETREYVRKVVALYQSLKTGF